MEIASVSVSYTSRWVCMGAISLSQPSSVAAAPTLLEDRIHIADTGNNRIQKYLLPKPSPQPVWENARGNGIAGNLEPALANFSQQTQNDFRLLFDSIGLAKLAELFGEIGQITPVYIDNDYAQSRFTVMNQGTPLTFLVTFVKEAGQWKIVDF